ncbi:MAG: ankyrin repeat domain-containing protein [Roseiarcus sp.]
MARSNLVRIAQTLGIALMCSVMSPADATDLDDCIQKSGQDAVDACTAVIERGDKESPKDRARAFYDRGIEYANQHAWGKAISDYSEAVKIDPKYGNALAARGLAFEAQGDLHRAHGDFEAAIALRNDDKIATEGLQRVNNRITALPDVYTDTLISAAGRGEVTAVKALIGKGANVNAEATNGATALIIASQRGYLDLVHVLIGSGANVNAAMHTQSDEKMEGTTALIAASGAGHLEIVKILLAKGATVDARTGNGQTALINASIEGLVDVVRALIENGADVNARVTTRGLTALMMAVVRDHLDVVKVLIADGADAFAEDSVGITAMMYSASNHKDVRKFLETLVAGPIIEVIGYVDNLSIGMHNIDASGTLQPAPHHHFSIIRCSDGHDYFLRWLNPVPDNVKVVVNDKSHIYKFAGQTSSLPPKFADEIGEFGASLEYTGFGSKPHDVSRMLFVRSVVPVEK